MVNPPKDCERFHRNGSKCENKTQYVDGWCREDNCDGFGRAVPLKTLRGKRDLEHQVRRRMNQSAQRYMDQCIDVSDIYDIYIRGNAIQRFVHYHGGSKQSADAQLRTMLEDFILDGRRFINKKNEPLLICKGYELALSKDYAAIVSYYTVHRERNWAQFCEGVASRSQNKFFYPGPSLTKEEVVQKLNPQLVILTGRIKSDYGRIFSVRQDELQLENQIRQALAEVKNGEINYARQKPGTEVLVGGLKWLIRDDAKMVLAVNLVESSNQDKNAS